MRAAVTSNREQKGKLYDQHITQYFAGCNCLSNEKEGLILKKNGQQKLQRH